MLSVAAVCLVACEPTDTDSKASKAPTAATGAPAGEPSKAADATAASKTVPSFVGMGLQSAQDAAQAAGFYSLKSHDSLGRDRMQAFDRNWKVCSQNVAAGKSVSTDTTLDFGSVKLEETCPSTDEKAPSAAGGKMPDFKGKSVKAARAALDSSTSISVKDATGSRWILVESNWKVCTQDPSPGATLKGQPVVFTAVKYEETCP